MPVRGGIAHPREEEHEDEDVRAHPALWWGGGLGKKPTENRAKKNQKEPKSA